MSNLAQRESEAIRLRAYLKIARSPELRIFCIFKFFKMYVDDSVAGLGASLSEFLPSVIESIHSADPAQFLPSDIGNLDHLLRMANHVPYHVCDPADLELLSNFRAKIDQILREPMSELEESDEIHRDAARVNCLFVEHYPDLGLEPRGRLLTLYTRALPLSKQAKGDEIIIRNPTESVDDCFVQQARDSVSAARTLLNSKFDLSPRVSFRFDFEINHRGARFTGDSLGLAFAVGALESLSETVILSDAFKPIGSVAFTGALSSDGEVEPVEISGLRRKIERAFFSHLQCVAVPSANVNTALEMVGELLSQYPRRELQVIGCDSLGRLASDPRLIEQRRLSPVEVWAKKLQRVKKALIVQLPLLLIATALAFYFFAPDALKFWRDHNPTNFSVTTNTVTVSGADGLELWSKTFACALDTGLQVEGACLAIDLDSDGMNEVAIVPFAWESCPEADSMYVYDSNGRLKFTRYLAIPGEYIGDTISMLYESPHVYGVSVNGDPVVITEVFQHAPARQHIKIWDKLGNERGWYVHAGGCSFDRVLDLNADGKDDLWFMAIANRMNCSGLFVLPADSAFGVSPPYDALHGYDLSRVKQGNQLAYMLFPKTDLGDLLLPNPYNTVDRFDQLKSDGFVIALTEFGLEQVLYEFDRDFRITRVVLNDQFAVTRDQAVNDGRLPKVDAEEYIRALRDRVLHFRDGRWITEGVLHPQ